MKEKLRYSFRSLGLCALCFTAASVHQSASAQTQDSTFLKKALNDSVRKAVKSSYAYQQPGSQIPVLFGTQRRDQLLQSQAIISGDELLSYPVAQLEGALYGKFAGLYIVQSSAKPGDDAAAVTLRGRTPLVLVDGVPRNLNSVNPEQIASVSVLKDALASSMYGMRGGNGLILIETKRGSISPRKISFTAQTAIQKQLNTPSFLNAADYSTLFNEALVNDGKQPVYTAEAIEKYRNGSDPIAYPNVDWYNTILKKKASLQRYNLNFSGGNQIARYFVDLDYLNQDGFFVSDAKRNSYETNNSFKRYGFRTNIDADLTKNLLLSLNIFGRIRNGNEPGAIDAGLSGITGSDVIYSSLLRTPNNAYPVLNPDGSFGGNQQFNYNLYGQVVGSGYRPSYNRNLGVDLSLRQKLDGLLDGLYIKGKGSFNTYYSELINRSKSFAVYEYFPNPGGKPTINKYGTDGSQNNTSSIELTNRQIYAEMLMGYDQVFGKHEINASLNFNSDNLITGSDLSLSNNAVAGRFQYNYSKKYFVELVSSYMGMNRYPKNHQWGFFPAAGLGWDISKEDFLKSFKALNMLKIRGSYGKSGDNAAAGYYIYDQFYTSTGSVYFGSPATSNSVMIEATLANPNITWETANKLNFGLDLAAFENKLQFSVEYYKNKYTDLLQQRGTNASEMLGNRRPNENLGERTYSGVELTAGYFGKSGQVNWFVNGNVSFSKSRIDFMDEVIRPYNWMKRTGLPVGQAFGMVADGFFNNQAEIDNSAKIDGYKAVPGDIRYKDLNGDGVINVFDEQAIGSTKPMVFYGLTAGFNYKGFEFSMVWNGVANRNVFVNGPGTYEFQSVGIGGYGQAFTHNLDRWTPATAATATYPRLTVGTNINNQRNSSFWLKNGSYLRLKNAELAYSLPERWISFLKIDRARVFVNGTNLLTFSNLERVDPEVISWDYPNQRVFNIGINLQF
ncbi:SusC/RagA family TonB-linked outer membrane protein [Pedobacter gandavensis]|uniref:SusC/RagA family TonB-linked outer membrane protein n=1 Tax=Pedobacter gandavensis TaxID=2679963 RepID=UPI00292D311B|nr:SusC/RagA family TonB-linked outer membrane protein [Pedobacter gandavensis]